MNGNITFATCFSNSAHSIGFEPKNMLETFFKFAYAIYASHFSLS